jgi:hypothetical protein
MDVDDDYKLFTFKSASHGRRWGGATYCALSFDPVTFTQETCPGVEDPDGFSDHASLGSGDILIECGKRFARLKMDRCRCPLLCHFPGPTSDEQVVIEEHAFNPETRTNPLYKYTVTFQPLVNDQLQQQQQQQQQ